jgi:multimeric flavodoxin WrbA
LGSPIYFSMVSGRMKTFLDKLNFYWWNKKLKNKKVFTVCSGAGPNT